MKYNSQIDQLLIIAYMIEQFSSHGDEGVTRDEIERGWATLCQGTNLKPSIERQAFLRYKEKIQHMGITIVCDSKHRYHITNRRQMRHNPLLSSTAECLMEYLFCTRYRKLGKSITPRCLSTGMEHVLSIAGAIERGVKIQVRYEPFGRDGYDATLHPYSLRVDQDRWYVLAYKEGNEHQLAAQVFALDRVKSLSLTDDTYPEPTAIDPQTHFDHSFGVYVDQACPPESVELLATRMVSDYLTTLPLHSSQINHGEQPDGRYKFSLLLRVTPDFAGALMKWGSGIEVLRPQSLRDRMHQAFRQALDRYE